MERRFLARLGFDPDPPTVHLDATIQQAGIAVFICGLLGLKCSTVSSILGLTLLSGGFSDGLVDCLGRDIECSRQSIDQPPSSMNVAGQ